MTWPWVLHLKDAASDPGDPYLISWILWWDYYQTFNDPLNLFHANIFYPYQYSLAFSEHQYGIALLCFPFFAAGLQPLTVNGIATLLGFAFSGYGAFRLGRTLTGSMGAAWVTGIAFAFVPYRFGHLPHLIYLFSGWIPILLEALVLYVRESSRKRAVWLGIAFFFNALTTIHWFVLTLPPLAVTGLLLIMRYRLWRDVAFWRRGTVAIGLPLVALLPFFLPYVYVARLYGFVRTPAEVQFYSANAIDWLVGEMRNKMWHGLNRNLRAGERQLFPGFVPPLLALAALFLKGRPGSSVKSRLELKSLGLLVLDLTMIASAVLMVTISGYGYFKLRIFGHYLFELHSTAPVVGAFLLALITRLTIAYPSVLSNQRERNLIDSLNSTARSDGFWIGVIWTLMGFLGSLGMNFVLHRALYEYVPLFKSIRVPARWAMICYLGLAILAGIGAQQLTMLLQRHWSKLKPPAFMAIALVLLIEQRAAPLELIRGEADPDSLAIHFKKTPMAGGIVELPFGEGKLMPYLYTLRAADHRRPLVTAVSGFMPPIQREIQRLTEAEPITDEFFALLESIPTSYLAVHTNLFEPQSRPNVQDMLRRGLEKGVLRYISTFDGKIDLFAVTKTEPSAKGLGTLPDYLIGNFENSTSVSSPLEEAQFFTRVQYLEVLGRDPDQNELNHWSGEIERCGRSVTCLREARVTVSASIFSGKEFHDTAFFLYRLYTETLGRQPKYEEFMRDRAALTTGPRFEERKSSFVDEWINRPEFKKRYPPDLSNQQFVQSVLNTASEALGRRVGVQPETLAQQLSAQRPRSKVLTNMLEQEPRALDADPEATVLLQYFVYLRRDPDAGGFAFWVGNLRTHGPSVYRAIIRSFLVAEEYRARFQNG